MRRGKAAPCAFPPWIVSASNDRARPFETAPVSPGRRQGKGPNQLGLAGGRAFSLRISADMLVSILSAYNSSKWQTMTDEIADFRFVPLPTLRRRPRRPRGRKRGRRRKACAAAEGERAARRLASPFSPRAGRRMRSPRS